MCMRSPSPSPRPVHTKLQLNRRATQLLHHRRATSLQCHRRATSLQPLKRVTKPQHHRRLTKHQHHRKRATKMLQVKCKDTMESLKLQLLVCRLLLHCCGQAEGGAECEVPLQHEAGGHPGAGPLPGIPEVPQPRQQPALALHHALSLAELRGAAAQLRAHQPHPRYRRQ